jgi:hypothetical protein
MEWRSVALVVARKTGKRIGLNGGGRFDRPRGAPTLLKVAKPTTIKVAKPTTSQRPKRRVSKPGSPKCPNANQNAHSSGMCYLVAGSPLQFAWIVPTGFHLDPQWLPYVPRPNGGPASTRIRSTAPRYDRRGRTPWFSVVRWPLARGSYIWRRPYIRLAMRSISLSGGRRGF